MLDSGAGPDADFDTWKADLLEQYQSLNAKVKVARVAANFGVPVGRLACQELLAPLRVTEADYEQQMHDVMDLKLYLTDAVLDVLQDRCRAFAE